LDDLGLGADTVGLDRARTSVVAADRRPARTAGQIVIDEGDGGLKLVEFLTAGKFV
jgi:electron transfer flavoprotein beta subunit